MLDFIGEKVKKIERNLPVSDISCRCIYNGMVQAISGAHRVPLLLIGAFIAQCAGHGAVVHPPPRNAVDGQIAPWNQSVPYPGSQHYIYPP